jgi:hypothetical protein
MVASLLPSGDLVLCGQSTLGRYPVGMFITTTAHDITVLSLSHFSRKGSLNSCASQRPKPGSWLGLFPVSWWPPDHSDQQPWRTDRICRFLSASLLALLLLSTFDFPCFSYFFLPCFFFNPLNPFYQI